MTLRTYVTEEDFLESLVSNISNVSFCNSPSFSPDGSQFAFISNMSGIPQVWRVSTKGGWPEQVTGLKDVVSKVTWSPEGSWLAFLVAPDGGMNSQIYIVRPDGTQLQRLTPGGKETNLLGAWSPDGNYIYFTSNLQDANSLDAFRVSLETKEWQFLAKTGGYGELTRLSHNGKQAILWREEQRLDNDLVLLYLSQQGGEGEVLLTPHQWPGNFQRGYFSPDGNIIYLSSNQTSDMSVFAKIQLNEGKVPGVIEVLAGREDAELYPFAISDDGKCAALVWNVGGRNTVSFMDLTTGEITSGPQLPAEVVADIAFSKDGNLLALNLTGAKTLFDIYIFDRSTNALKQITFSPHPGVALEELVTPELVSYPSHDGLTLTAWFYRPTQFKEPGPVVMSYHGGPEAQERPAFVSLYQGLCSQGIAVLAPNVRGSAGFGKKFLNLANGALRVNAVRDIKSSIDYLVQSGTAHPHKIGIVGGSYGGFMVSAAITTYPQEIAAAASFCGIINFETFFANTEPWMAATSKIIYGDPETEVELLRELSPIHKVDQIITPTIVLHGLNDTNAPVIESEQLVESLKKRGVPVEYILFPDEGHGFRKLKNKIQSNLAMVRWFVKYLS